MIDIHSHILPSVDDGSLNDEQSLDMIREAVRQGVKTFVLTPHYRADYITKRETLQTAFDKFKEMVAAEGVGAKLYLGQEIYAFDGLVPALDSGKVLTMNGSKYVLVEFSLNRPMDIPEIAYTLISHGYVPIIAHLERYKYADEYIAHEIKEIGGLIQINAGSLCCRGGYKRRASDLIKRGFVDFVASDVHYNRENFMLKAYCKVAKKFGTATAEKLFCENAKNIVE